MNHVYRLVWSAARSSFVVVHEFARSHSKNGSRAGRRSGGRAVDASAAPIGLALLLAGGLVQADPLPTGGEIVAGSGNIQLDGTTLNIQQASDKLIANWQSFNIATGHSVNFQQPGAEAVALNRITGTDASEIYGALRANGQVFLINPNGILFSEGASIDVGGLVASTLDISNENFLQGNYVFEGSGGSIVNRGSITAEGGVVALLGGQVRNDGLIAARLGSVALAAGEQISLDFAGDGLLSVTVDRSAFDALVANHQIIRADGGQVLMTAKASEALLQTVVNNSGIIEARTVEQREGRIVLLGGFDGGTVEVAGTLDASAPDGGDGGFVETSGAHVRIAANTEVTAKAAQGKSGEWLVDPLDVVVDEAMATAISTTLNNDTDFTLLTAVPTDGTADPGPGQRGNITVEAEIRKTEAPSQSAGDITKTLAARGDVIPGVETEALPDGMTVVYVDRYETNELGDVNLVSQKLYEQSEAQALLQAGDPGAANFKRYEISAVPAGVEVVNIVKREYDDVPTLTLSSGIGNVNINAPIRSINGVLNVVLKAGASEGSAYFRDESVNINADILTNGGDIAVHANEKVHIADTVMLSTRDVFGIDPLAARSTGMDVGQINPLLFGQDGHIAADAPGESGNIVLWVDKFDNGFTNFALFYRSDLASIEVGAGAALLAESDGARDGSIRLLAVANIGDLFEAINWLFVRNFSAATIDIGSGAKIRGGAVDLIANSYTDADVGNVVDALAFNTASGVLNELSPVVTLNDDDAAQSLVEQRTQAMLDFTSDPMTAHLAAEEMASDPDAANDLPGFQADVVNLPTVPLQVGTQAGALMTKVVEYIPFIGDILTLSPIAIAVAESRATVNVGQNAHISGQDVVTVHANSAANAYADASFPGLALSLTVNNSKASVDVQSGAVIESFAPDRQDPTAQILNDQPLLRFDTGRTESFGVMRDFLQPKNRDSQAAVDVAAYSEMLADVDVAAATLALDVQEKIADDAAKARAKKDGNSEVPASKRAIDSPVDIALGIIIANNESTVTIAENARVAAPAGTASIGADAVMTKIINNVTGGSLQTPGVQCTEAVSSDCHTTAEYDGSDIVNIALAITSTSNKATTTIAGRVSGETVDIHSAATSEKFSSGAVSNQGYDSNYDQEDAADAIRGKLKTKNDPSKTEKFQNKIKESFTGLAEKIKGKTGTTSNTKVSVIEAGPENQLFGLAGGVTVSVIDQKAQTIIEGTAELESHGGTMAVGSETASGIINNYAKTGVQTGRTNAVAASVAVGIYAQNADTKVNDGASLRAIAPHLSQEELDERGSSTINISAQSYIDSPFMAAKYTKASYKNDKLLMGVTKNGPQGVIQGFTGGDKGADVRKYAAARVNELLDNGQLLTTNWATSYFINNGSPAYQGKDSFLGTEKDANGDPIPPPTEELNAKTDYSSDVAVAGAFGILTTDNNATVEIGKASFEVVNGTQGNANDITMVADAWQHTVMAGGNIAPPDPEADTIQESFAPGDRAGKGMGGSLNIQEGSSAATVNIKDGASFDTEYGTMASVAQNHRETQLVQVSGGLAGDIGVNGAIGINVFNDDAIARVADGAKIDAAAVEVGANVYQPGVFNLSGGFSVSGAVGVGLGVGVNVISRDAEAVLGYVGSGAEAGAGGWARVDDLVVTSVQEGFITNIDVAGGIQAPESKAKQVQGGAGTTATSQTSPTDAATKAAGGVGLSGSVAVNISNATTKAHARLDDGSSINESALVRADDAVDLTGLAGGAGITINGGVAVAGAAAINTIDNQTDAILEARQSDGNFASVGAAYTPYDVEVSAANIGRIEAVAVGLALVAGVPDEEGGSGPSVAVAGTLTYNSVRNDAFASIDNSRLVLELPPALPPEEEEETAVRVLANDGAQITSVAGAVAISLGDSNNVAAVGASVAVNTIQNTTEADVSASRIEDADSTDSKGLVVGASRISPIYSFGIAGGVGSSKVAAAGSVVVNTINTEAGKGTFANIENSTVDTAGAVSVYTGDEAQIVSLAGAVAATSGNVAAGGSFVWNEIAGGVGSSISGSNLMSDTGINVQALTESPDAVVDTPLTLDALITEGKTVATNVGKIVSQGARAGLALRKQANAPTVAAIDSNDLVEGSNGIYSAAVAGGGADKVAAFGSFSVNSLHKDITTTVSDSTLTSAGDVLMMTQADAHIRSLAGTVSISLGAAAVGGAGTYNTIRDRSLVSLENSDVSGQDVLVSAGRSGSVKTLGAGAAVASNVGVQGSAAITTLVGETASSVQGGSISAQGRAAVTANASVDSAAIAGGIAGGGTVAVGASVAVTVAEDKTSAVVGTEQASEINGGSAVDIKAQSRDQHDTAAMTVSVGGTVGVAGSIGIKVINTETTAAVGKDTVVNKSGYNGTVNVISDAGLILTGAAGAIGASGTAGVGAGLDLNVVNSLSSATIGDGAMLRGLDINVEAQNQRDLGAITIAGAGGLAGVAGAVSVVHVGGGDMHTEGAQALGQEDYTDEDGKAQRAGDVKAHAQGMIDARFSPAQISTVSTTPASGDTLAYVGAATLQATDDVSIKAEARHDVDVLSGALAGGVVGVGAGVTSVTYNSQTRAITQNAILTAGDDVAVTAGDQDKSTHTPLWLAPYTSKGERGNNLDTADGDDFAIHSFAGAGGLAALGAAISVVDRDNSTSAEIRGGATLAGDRIDVDADRDRYTRVLSLGAQVGAAAVGASIADLNNDGTVLASAGGNIGAEGNEASVLSVDATGDNRNTVKAVAAASGVLLGATGTVAIVHGNSLDLDAEIADDASVHLKQSSNGNTLDSNTGRVDLLAQGSNTDYVYADGTNVGLGAGVGAVEARNSASSSADTRIGDNAVLEVQGFITLSSDIKTAELDDDDKYHPTSVVEARGAAAGLIAGVNSIVSVSEQNISSGVDIGSGAKISGSRIVLDANTLGGSNLFAGGGAFAGLAGVNSISSFDLDHHNAGIKVGENAGISGNTIEFFSDANLLNEVGTSAISGGIANATLVQNSNTTNLEGTRRLTTKSDISVADGAKIDSVNNTTFLSRGFFGGWTQGNGSAGGASAITTINSKYHVDQNAGINIGAADIMAGRDLRLVSTTDRNLLTSFKAEAFGAGAGATVNLDARVVGGATLDLGNGANLTGGLGVELRAEDLQRAHKLEGLAEIGAAVGSADTKLDSTVSMQQQIDLAAGSVIRSPDILITADEGASTRTETIKVEQKNQSLTFFLESDKQNITRSYTPSVHLGGDLYSTAEGGGSLTIERRFNSTLINGRPADMDAVGTAYLEETNDSFLRITDLAPNADGGSIKVDAGNGAVDGEGKFYNAGGFYESIDIKSSIGVLLEGISMFGKAGAEPAISVISGNGYRASVEELGVTTPTLRVEADGGIRIDGDIDVGAGNTILLAHGTAVNQTPSITQVSGTLRTGTLDVRAESGSVGTEAAPLTVSFVDDGDATAAALSGTAKGSNLAGEFHLDAVLEGIDPRLELGDIDARDLLSLVLGAVQGGGVGTYAIGADSQLSSLGQVKIDTLGVDTILTIDGSVLSGFDLPDSSLDITIKADGSVESDWPGLYSQLDDTDEGQQLILGHIGRKAGGVVINAPNLNGSGSVTGNGGGIDITLTNENESLTALSSYGITMEAAVAVSINGDSSSSTVNGITVNRSDSAGDNAISIIDPYSDQFVILGDIRTSGDLTLDFDDAFSVHMADVFGTPMIAAHSLTLKAPRATALGSSSLPLQVQLGTGGLSLRGAGGVFIDAHGGDLLINELHNQGFPGLAQARTFITAPDGSISAAPGAFIMSETVDFSAAGNIAMGSFANNISGAASLSGIDIDWWGENVVFGSVTASGDLSVDALESLTGGPLVVGGSTSIIGRNVVLNNPFNDFTGALSFERSGAGSTAFTLYDRNDLLLGDITALAYPDAASDTTQLFITAADSISQVADTAIVSQINATLVAGADILLDQEGNWFDGSFINLTADNAVVASKQAEGLDLGTINLDGDLTVSLAGPLTQTGILTINGKSSFTTADNLTLFHANNTFGGAVSLDVTGDLQLGSTSSIDLGDTAVFGQTYIASGSGDITDSGTLDFTGDVLVLAQNGDIVLDTADNSLGRIGGQANNVTLVNGDDLLGLYPFEIPGKLTVDAATVGFLTQVSATHTNKGSYGAWNDLGALDLRVRDSSIEFPNPSNPAESFVVHGDVDLRSDFIKINNADFRGAIGVHGTASSYAEITNNAADSTVILGNALVGTLLVNVPDGSIQQKADTGIEAFIAEVRASGDISLDGAGNDFAELNVLSGKHVTIVDQGTLKVRVDSSAIPDFSVQSLDLTAGTITVGEAADSLIDPELTLAAKVNVLGDLALTSNNGNLILDGDEGLNIGGDASLTASGLLYIKDFTQIAGKLSLEGGDVDVYRTYTSSLPGETALPVALGDVVSHGDLNVFGSSITMDSIQVAGNAVLRTDFWSEDNAVDGSIVSHGIVDIGGTTHLISVGDVLLDNVNNRFGGAVTIFDSTAPYAHRRTQWGTELELPSIDVTLVAGDDILLGNVTMPKNTGPNGNGVVVWTGPGSFSFADWPTGTLSVTSAGDISQSTALVLPGAVSLNAGGAITLAHADNDFQTALNVSGASVNITDKNALSFASLATTGGDLALSASTISLPNAINIQGAASFNATGAVNAVNTANVITGAVSATADTLNLYTDSDLQLGSITTVANLDLKSVQGSILFDAGSQLDIGGNANFDSRNGALALSGANTKVAGNISMIAQDISLVSDGAVKLGTVSTCRVDIGDCAPDENYAGDISITGTSITQYAPATARGKLSLTATAGDLIFDAGLETNIADSASLSASGTIDAILQYAVDWGFQLFAPGAVDIAASTARIGLRGEAPVLGSVTVGDQLELFLDGGDGTLTQNAALDVSGDLRISSGGFGARQSVLLNHADNHVGGSVTIRAADISLSVADTLRLGELSAFENDSSGAEGLMFLSSGADIVGDGDTFLSYDDEVSLTASNDVTLVDTGTGGNRNVNVSARNLSITGFSLPNLGDVTLSGDLYLEQTEPDPWSFVSGRGDFNVAGKTTVLTSGGVSLGNEDSVFTGAVSLRAGGDVSIDSKSTLTFSGIDMTPAEGGGQQQCQQCQGPGGGGALPTTLEITVSSGDIVVDGPLKASSVMLKLGEGGNVVMEHKDNVLGSELGAELEPWMHEFTAQTLFEFSEEGTPEPGPLGSIRLYDSTDLELRKTEGFPEWATLNVDGDIIIQSGGSLTLRKDVSEQWVEVQVEELNPETGEMETFWSEELVEVTTPVQLRAGGNIVLAADENFFNDSGMVDPLDAAGRWLVYSSRPDFNLDDISMAKDFFAYGTSYDALEPIPAALPEGNGLVYRIQPTLEGVSLTVDSQSIVYGEDIDTTVSAATLDGAITGVSFDGDLIADPSLYGIDLPDALTVDDVNVALNETVVSRSNGGFVNAGSYAEGLSITINPASASGLSGLAIGGKGQLTVTAADLVVTSADVEKTYDGSTTAAGSAMVTGGTSLRAGDLLSGGSFVFAAPDAGIGDRTVNVADVLIDDGNGGNNYNVVYQANSTSTINPASLSVTAYGDTKVYNGLAYTGGNGVSYSGFVNGEDASVLGGTLSYGGSSQGAVNVGNYAITPQGLTAGNYAISFIDGVLAVTPASLTLDVAADDKTKIYGDVDPVFTWQITDGTLIGSDQLSGALARDAGENVGSYAIRQGSLTAGENYSITFANGVLDITPRHITVTTADVVKTYDGSTTAIGSPITTGSTLGFSDTLSGGSYAFNDANAGSNRIVSVADVTVNDGNNGNNYVVSYQNNSSSTIEKAPLAVTANALTRLYDGSAFAGGNGITYSGFVNGENESVITGTLAYTGSSQGAVNVGSYAITPQGLAAGNYAISFVDGELSITPASLTLDVAADDKSKVYGEADPLFTFQASGFVGSDTADLLSGSLTRDPGENVGDYAIRQGTLNAGDNYVISFSNGVLSITPRPLSITSSSVQKAYDGTTSANGSLVLQSGNLVNGHSLSGGSFAFATPNAGSNRRVDVSGVNIDDGNDGNNYSITYVPNTSSSIDPVELIVTANDQNLVYDGNAYSGGNGVSYSGFVNGEGAEVLGGALAFGGSSQGAVDAGYYELTPSGYVSSNYVISYVDGSLRILPVGLVLMGIGADDKSKVYGETDPELTWQITDGALVEGDSFTGALARDAGENVGDYTIRQGTLSAGDNYEITFANGVLTITPAALTVKANDFTRTYDGSAYSGGNGVSYSGFVNGDDADALDGTLDYAGDSQGAVDAGTYVITPTGLSAGNYTISFEDGTLVIDPAELEFGALGIAANDATKVFGDADPGLSWSLNAGQLAPGDAVTGSLQRDPGENAGSYAIRQGSLDAGPNYTINFSDGVFTITPRPLSVTAADVVKTYDGSTAASSTVILSAGSLVNGHSLGGGSFAFVDANAGSGKTVNVSDVVVNDGNGGANYALSYVPNTSSTINRAPLVLSATTDGKVYDGTTGSTASVNISGLQGSDSVSGLTQAFDSIEAGTRSLVITGFTVNDGNAGGNYDVVLQTATGVIERALLTLTPEQRSKVYGVQFDFTGTEFSITDGQLLGDDQIVSVTLFSQGADLGAAPGTYDISITGANGAGLTNYQISFASAPDGFTVEAPSTQLSDVLTVVTSTVVAATQQGNGGNGNNGQGQGGAVGGGIALGGGLPPPASTVADTLLGFADGAGGAGGIGGAGGPGGAGGAGQGQGQGAAAQQNEGSAQDGGADAQNDGGDQNDADDDDEDEDTDQ